MLCVCARMSSTSVSMHACVGYESKSISFIERKADFN